MEKMKVWVIFISLVSLMIVVYSCSSDDSFFDEMKTNEVASRSVTPNLDTILNSPEFQNLDKTYTELISIIRSSVENLTQDEMDEFSELYLLYNSDSLKYESLFKYFVCDVLLENNYQRTEQAYKLFESARGDFLQNKVCKTYIESNKEFIASILMQNAGQIKPMIFSIKTIKTRSEVNVQKCLDLCKEQYDSDINNAYKIMGCATVFNIGACVLGLGITVPMTAWTQVSIFALYELAVSKAEDDYRICKEGCYI